MAGVGIAFCAVAGVTFAIEPPVGPTLGPALTRPASAAEAAFCEANLELLGPITGDCGIVPLAGGIEEDDPWGRWDCRTMGNNICGTTIFFDMDGEWRGFALNDRHRPACFVEPSNTPAGFEIIFYSRMSGRGAPEHLGDPLGFEVRCPP